ncbi:MAG: ComEC/Rec2 family competence protein [Patescibacteria group bacterium]|nr:ComEC/Rec2 family competence protein [Patescibacteria group bacterium]
MSPKIFTDVINLYLPEPHSSLLNGILFGIDIKTTKDFYQQLKIVGLLHLVVLSGINITLLVSIISSITSYFSKTLSILITILTIIIFIIFVGIKAPILRATFMSILTLVAIQTGRKNYSLYALFLSFLLSLILYPNWIKSVSFQLSYGATLGIIFFGQSKLKKTKNRIINLINHIKSDFKTSIAAQIFTVPIIFIYFKQISLISPIANIMVSFLIPSLMFFGFLTVILGKINYYLGLPFAWFCYLILSYMIWVIDFLSKIPGISINFQ